LAPMAIGPIAQSRGGAQDGGAVGAPAAPPCKGGVRGG
jgi:hypothetical protein